MEDLRRIVVNEHLAELRRDADAVRVTRRVPHQIRDGDADCGEPPNARPARVRLGHWLIGVGTAVAGTSADPRGGTARNTA